MSTLQQNLESVTIKSRRLQAQQRFYASLVVVIPFLATVFAVWWAARYGIGAMEITLLVVFHALTTIGATVGFHRHFAHRAFQAHPAVRRTLAILGSMAAQGPLVYWVATHRRHHTFSDRPGDPHSPNLEGPGLKGFIRGMWHAHIEWLFNSEITNSPRFAKDVLRDPVLVQLNKEYYLWALVGLALPAAIGGLWAWSWLGVLTGFLWGGMVRLFIVHHAFWSIGDMAHKVGTRRFDTREESVNNFLIALPNFGEGWHNNHHAFPSSADFGLRWWQVDVGAWVVRLLEKTGLIWDVRRPTEEMMAAKSINSSESKKGQR